MDHAEVVASIIELILASFLLGLFTGAAAISWLDEWIKRKIKQMRGE